MVLMIIKGLFRRYERWNPVHPTSGAFWGMGVGIGCGVGWGPGFGPEVIGYVGAGCGIGFSVGITLAGFGIGLPANFLIETPYKALIATRTHAREFVQSSNLLSLRSKAGDEWSNNIPPQIWSFQQKANESFSYLKDIDLLKKRMELFDLKSSIFSHTKFVSESLRSFKSQFSDSGKDIKD